MPTKEELQQLKEEFDSLTSKLKKLNYEELRQVVSNEGYLSNYLYYYYLICSMNYMPLPKEERLTFLKDLNTRIINDSTLSKDEKDKFSSIIIFTCSQIEKSTD